MSLLFSCHCIRCTNHRREHSQEHESHTLIDLFLRKECISVWSSRVRTGSVTWLRPERMRRRLPLLCPSPRHNYGVFHTELYKFFWKTFWRLTRVETAKQSFSEGGKRRKRAPRVWRARASHARGRVRRASRTISLAVFSLAPAFRSNMVRRSRSQKIRLFCSLTRVRKIAKTWDSAKLISYLSPIISPILDCFYPVVLILFFRCVTVKTTNRKSHDLEYNSWLKDTSDFESSQSCTSL